MEAIRVNLFEFFKNLDKTKEHSLYIRGIYPFFDETFLEHHAVFRYTPANHGSYGNQTYIPANWYYEWTRNGVNYSLTIYLETSSCIRDFLIEFKMEKDGSPISAHKTNDVSRYFLEFQ